MKKLQITSALILALGMITDDWLTFEFICDYKEYGPRFYGFPFVQETNTSWVNSMSGEIYLFGFLGNLLFWTFIFYVIILIINRIKNKIIVKLCNGISLVFVLIALLNSFVYFSVIDWRLEKTHDNFKLNYYTSDIKCERKFKLFKLE